MFISWEASEDNIAVEQYVIYQNGIQVSHDSITSFNATNLKSGTTYRFAVRALDGAGNISDFTPQLALATLKGGMREDSTEIEPVTVDSVLIFTKTAGFRHASIEKGIATLSDLAADNNFVAIASEEASDISPTNLSNYDLVIFLNTTGDVLNDTHQAAFENYIRSGGSFMGIHSATDTEYDWPWYGQLVGAYFDGHPPVQEATAQVMNSSHSSTAHLSSTWTRTDEWYNFKDLNPNIAVLLNLDETSYNGGTNGQDHPISWYHEFDGGRSFYTGGGHTDAAYDEPAFQMHLLGGIEYCLGR